MVNQGSVRYIGLGVLVLMLGACRNEDPDGFAGRAAQVVPVQECETLSGTPWAPNVAGAGASNHDASVTVTREVLTASGLITGVTQAAPASREISVTIDMTQDLGPLGSLTLAAEVLTYPSALSGSAYPLLVSLSDGVNEYVNLARSGAAGDCAQSGYYSWDGSTYVMNPACAVSWPTAFGDTAHWSQRQVMPFGYMSVNTFPTCNWAGGTGGSSNAPACAFNSNLFVGGKLRSGVNYTAKFVLLSSHYTSVPDNYSAALKVTAVKKRSFRGAVGGAVDLNVILVGQDNVKASRTEAGKRNLDTLMAITHEYLGQASSAVQVGAIQVYEWGCREGGQAYTYVDLVDTEASNYIGKMIAEGSAKMSAEGEGRALNVFLVTGINASSENASIMVVGASGGIGGPPLNGREASGLVFSSLNQLASYNPQCTSTPCPTTTRERDFFEFGITIAHEIGHFLGLNHPSERDGASHDQVLDTPLCTATVSVSGDAIITPLSCLGDTNPHPVSNLKCSDVCTVYNTTNGDFCENVSECQFNHLMWWVSKNYNQTAGRGDGNLVSTHSGVVVNYSPFVQ